MKILSAIFFYTIGYLVGHHDKKYKK